MSPTLIAPTSSPTTARDITAPACVTLAEPIGIQSCDGRARDRMLQRRPGA